VGRRLAALLPRQVPPRAPNRFLSRRMLSCFVDRGVASGRGLGSVVSLGFQATGGLWALLIVLPVRADIVDGYQHMLSLRRKLGSYFGGFCLRITGEISAIC
jgi:hypothetical protein